MTACLSALRATTEPITRPQASRCTRYTLREAIAGKGRGRARGSAAVLPPCHSRRRREGAGKCAREGQRYLLQANARLNRRVYLYAVRTVTRRSSPAAALRARLNVNPTLQFAAESRCLL